MPKNTVTLDVREDIRSGREPFSRIMQAVSSLSADQELLLIAPFEPVPLFSILARQGFQHQAEPLESGDWRILFTRQAHTASKQRSDGVAPSSVAANRGKKSAPSHSTPATAAQVSAPEDRPAPIEELDARGLEPPQPLVKILEKLARLAPGARLRARTDRRPMHLYSHLEERGFTAETSEASDGSYITDIRRP